jgi:zinc transport system substrate-binding protein
MKNICRKFLGIFSITLAVWVPSTPADGKLIVFVSIAPQKYFVQQIGKELVEVQMMVPPGADPHTYEPKPKQMVAISQAKLYFAIGIEFEKARLKKISSVNPKMKVVHTDQAIQKIPMTAPRYHDEMENRDKNQHAHGRLDPHIWLSPPLVMIQTRTILAALQNADPAHRSRYEANFITFMSSISALDDDLRATFSGKQGLQFMVFHPAWGYFAKTYGLRQVPAEIEGKNPKPAQLKKLIELAQKNDIKVIFVQPQFSDKSAKLIAREISGQVVSADPLAEDWAGNMRLVAEKFKAALR